MISISIIVASLAAFASAQVAPVNKPTTFQSLLPLLQVRGIEGCLTASANSDGAPVVFHNCATIASTMSASWTVVKGGSTVPGTGPAGQIKIFGNKCLDNTNGLNADGNKLQIWTCDTNGANPNQNWNVNSDFTITLSNSNKCVDLTNANITDGNVIQLWTTTANDKNQQWAPQSSATPPPPASNAFQITTPEATSTKQCITASGSTNGSPVTIKNCAKSSPGNATWVVAATDTKPGSLSTFGSKCLDVTGGVNADGTRLQVWDCTGGPNQQFLVSGGTINWSGSNKFVDLTNGNFSDGNIMQIWTGTGGPNQKFTFTAAT